MRNEFIVKFWIELFQMFSILCRKIIFKKLIAGSQALIVFSRVPGFNFLGFIFIWGFFYPIAFQKSSLKNLSAHVARPLGSDQGERLHRQRDRQRVDNNIRRDCQPNWSVSREEITLILPPSSTSRICMNFSPTPIDLESMGKDDSIIKNYSPTLKNKDRNWKLMFVWTFQHLLCPTYTYYIYVLARV